MRRAHGTIKLRSPLQHGRKQGKKSIRRSQTETVSQENLLESDTQMKYFAARNRDVLRPLQGAI
jgi:hypothetical protein